MKAIQHKIEYFFFKSLLVLLKITPNRIVPKLASGFGLLLYYLRVRRKVVSKNLSIAFSDELSEVELKKICKNTYKNVGESVFELLLMRYLSPEKINEFITIEGMNILESAVKLGRGVVIAGNHFGNFELLAAGISSLGVPIHLFTGEQKNTRIDTAVNEIRQKFGSITISKSKTAAFEMMKVLRNKKVLGLAGDLNVPHDNLFIDFFSKKAVVGQGLAMYTLKCKTPLIFTWCVREGPLKHRGYIKRLDYQITGNNQVDMLNISQMISSQLEEIIRKYPDQYFWLNRRWKTRPPEEKGMPVY
ncbi:hypothetical protein KKA14_22065 [bacterium]|nr:hypothetical protein [bacterium]